MYSEKVMEHFSNPRNIGEIENADGVGEVGNPVCGDMMSFYINVEDNKITDVKFKTFGCVAAIAVSSMVTEMAMGKTLENPLQNPWTAFRRKKCTAPTWAPTPYQKRFKIMSIKK